MLYTAEILKPRNQCRLTDLESINCAIYKGLKIITYKDKQGRIRLIANPDYGRVSALFLESYGKTGHIISGVYTKPNHRRRGYARKLLEYARTITKNVRHNNNLSPDGKKWAYSVEGIKA